MKRLEGIKGLLRRVPGPGMAGLAPLAMPLAVFLLLAVPMLAAAVAVERVAEPAACASCHMGDKLNALGAAASKDKGKGGGKGVVKGAHPPQMAAHDGISCRSCHSDVRIIREALLEGTPAARAAAGAKGGTGGGAAAQSGVKALKSAEPASDVSDAACTSCHDMSKHRPKQGAAVNGAHDKHARIGVGCQECHVRAIHGEVGSDGKQVQFPKPKHEQCMGCHKKNTPVGTWPPTLVRCPTCHLPGGMGDKPSFHDAAWVALPTNHGPSAFQMGAAVCAGCHGFQRIDDSLADKDVSDPRLFARNNYWCSGCHLNNRPPRHSENWRIIHKTQALPGFNYCMVCHNTDQPDGTKLATELEQRAVQKIWCNRCHNPADGRKHPPAKDWLPVHYQYVKSKGPVEGRCFYCHNTNHCLTCHNSKTAKILMEYYREQWRKEGKEPPPPPQGIPLGVPPEMDRRF